MSKLQKKKSYSEKLKRKTSADKKSASGVSAASRVSSPAAPAAPKAKQASGEQSVVSDNMFSRAADFIREVKVELKKVTWPTRKQTTGTTIVVILFVFVVAAFLGLFDYSLSRLVQIVLT